MVTASHARSCLLQPPPHKKGRGAWVSDYFKPRPFSYFAAVPRAKAIDPLPPHPPLRHVLAASGPRLLTSG
jgi:hypothetical protein